jgi:hypothetical protein
MQSIDYNKDEEAAIDKTQHRKEGGQSVEREGAINISQI